MFEWLTGFWGGVVTVFGGIGTILVTYRMLTLRPSRIAFDMVSYRPVKPWVPDFVDVKYSVESQTVKEIIITDVFIKNETGAALTDSVLVQPLRIDVDNASKVLLAKVLTGHDPSSASLTIDKKNSSIAVGELVVPIDSSLLIEIVSDEPIGIKVYCVPSNAKLLQRNYASLIHMPGLPLLGGVFFILAVIFISLIFGVFGADPIGDSLKKLADELVSRGFNSTVTAVIVLLMLFGVGFVFTGALRLTRSITHSERRFSRLKSRYLGLTGSIDRKAFKQVQGDPLAIDD